MSRSRKSEVIGEIRFRLMGSADVVAAEVAIFDAVLAISQTLFSPEVSIVGSPAEKRACDVMAERIAEGQC